MSPGVFDGLESNLPTVGESREAERLGAEWNTRLRSQAALLIHCIDCDGALLATITWVDGGRPLAAAKEKGDRLARERHIPWWWACTWADRGTVLHARIGSYRHVVLLSDVRAQLPPAGAPYARMKVRHDPDGPWPGACKPLT
jgi:hypothetical protein